MPNLDPFHWTFVAIGLLIVGRIVFVQINSSSNLTPDQFPENVRAAVNETLPGFQMESASSVMKRKFIIKGTYRDQIGRVEVELDRRGEVEEVEYEEVQASFSSKHFRTCDVSEIPAAVNGTVTELLGPDDQSFEPYEAMKGKVNGESGYKLKGRLAGWKWEFEVLENGRLIELEKERSRF